MVNEADRHYIRDEEERADGGGRWSHSEKIQNKITGPDMVRRRQQEMICMLCICRRILKFLEP